MSGSRVTGNFLSAALATLCAVASPIATAGIVISGTRVVYPAEQREVTINIDNSSETPSLVQAWIDDGQSELQPGESIVPFVLTPPLFRLDPTNSQSLRMVYTQDPLPTDRESLFWLNVLDIPPRAGVNPERPNQLEMAFKHRMKIFFRPPELPGSASDAPARLSWRLILQDDKLVGVEVNNPSPYHVSFARVSLIVDGQGVTAEPDMVGPFATTSMELPEPMLLPATSVDIEFWFINDYGGNEMAEATASMP